MHQELGHLGMKAVLAALQTQANIPYAQEMVEQTKCDVAQLWCDVWLRTSGHQEEKLSMESGWEKILPILIQFSTTYIHF